MSFVLLSVSMKHATFQAYKHARFHASAHISSCPRTSSLFDVLWSSKHRSRTPPRGSGTHYLLHRIASDVPWCPESVLRLHSIALGRPLGVENVWLLNVAWGSETVWLIVLQITVAICSSNYTVLVSLSREVLRGNR